VEIVQSLHDPGGQTFQGSIDDSLEFGAVHPWIETWADPDRIKLRSSVPP
jgi:hypothetical protein